MLCDVLCVGNASYDIYFPLGEFPVENQKYTTEIFLEACGGPASNAAFLLSLWDMKTAFAGCIGDDSFGRTIRDEFLTAGVDIRLMEERTGFHTPLSVILTNEKNGSRTIVNRRRRENRMNFVPQAFSVLKPSFLLFDGQELEASLYALKINPRAVSVLDAGSRRKGTEILAGEVSFLITSERFACDITGNGPLLSDESMILCAENLQRINPNPGAVTLGDRGVLFWTRKGIFLLDAFRVNAVDSTAAGDIFHGAFVYAFARAADGTVPGGLRKTEDVRFEKSLIFAAAAAALSVEVPGGRCSIPEREKVQALIKKGPPAKRPLKEL